MLGLPHANAPRAAGDALPDPPGIVFYDKYYHLR